MMEKMKRNNSGQAVLVVLFIMVVVLTITLSLLSHSVTDVSISKDEEEAVRAFSAAEAGIEEALRQDDLSAWAGSGRSVEVGELSAEVAVSGARNNIEIELVEDEYLLANLQGAAAGTELTISWEPDAALEIVFYKDDGLTTEVQAVKSPAVFCAENFDQEADNQVNHILEADDSQLRIRSICNETVITLSGSDDLPIQKHEVSSRAVVGGQERSKTSVIQVSRTLPAPPSILDYVLFSGGNLE